MNLVGVCIIYSAVHLIQTTGGHQIMSYLSLMNLVSLERIKIWLCLSEVSGVHHLI